MACFSISYQSIKMLRMKTETVLALEACRVVSYIYNNLSCRVERDTFQFWAQVVGMIVEGAGSLGRDEW